MLKILLIAYTLVEGLVEGHVNEVPNEVPDPIQEGEELSFNSSISLEGNSFKDLFEKVSDIKM